MKKEFIFNLDNKNKDEMINFLDFIKEDFIKDKTIIVFIIKNNILNLKKININYDICIDHSIIVKGDHYGVKCNITAIKYILLNRDLDIPDEVFNNYIPIKGIYDLLEKETN